MKSMNTLGRRLPGWPAAIGLVTCFTLLTPSFAENMGKFADNLQPATHYSYTSANEQGQYRYLITFAEPGLLRQPIGRASGERFDIRAPGMPQAQQQLMAQQVEYRQAMADELNRVLVITHYYLVTHSGMAVWLAPEEAQRIARLPGIVTVERERVYELATYRGPWFIGADTIWDGTNVPSGAGLRGEGMIIGILDTGIDPDHPSFANDPACGHAEGGAPEKLISYLDCASTDTVGMCNGNDPVDTERHGTHVASIAGGNFLDAGTAPPPEPPGSFTSISGIAPCVHLRSYKVCPSSCPVAHVRAGMESVLLHGDIDVMNFSISGGTDPWNDTDRRKLDLVDADVFVAAAAGNIGANQNPIGRVYHRGPWVLSVAASSHDGDFFGVLSVSGPGAPPAEIQDIRMNRGTHSPVGESLTDHPIRYFSDQPGGFEGCTPGEGDAPPDMAPFPPAFFEDAAALIQRGGCAFTTKIANAFDAGADLVVIRNNNTNPLSMLTTGQPPVPAYSIEQVPGDAVAAFVGDNSGTATIDFELIPIQGDVLADFSLRGPTPAPLQHLTKPDIAAPGISVYAAVPVSEGGYLALSGTSMAGPHAAGAATLVRQARPDWTVSEVKSAMMMTAAKGGTKEDEETPWDWDDVGHGRVDLTKATLAGLVMDEIFDNYLSANPAAGGDVRVLNIPALRDLDCTPDCTWTRTVRNNLEVPTSWSAVSNTPTTSGFEIVIDPQEFTFGGDIGETQGLTISAIPLMNVTEPVAFGGIILSEASGLSPDQHMTVAIKGGSMLETSPGGFDVWLQEGQATVEVLNIANLSSGRDLNWAIAEDGSDCELPEWLSVNPESGTLNGGADEDVELHLDAGALSAGSYQTDLCIDSNDTVNPLLIVPLHLTVILPLPSVDISPAGFEFQVSIGETREEILMLENTGGDTGNGILEWSIASDAIKSALSGELHDSKLDELFELPDFILTSFSNGGEPVAFTLPASGGISGVEVVGFSYVGTASRISGTNTWASDTCMVVEAPDSTKFGVGGLVGVIDGCGNQNAWAFHGIGSTNDGTYESVHDNAFDPPVIDKGGEWNFIFVNDFDSVEAADITWTDVIVTLHKSALPSCDDPGEVQWLSVTPSNGILSPGEQAPVMVTVDSTGLVGGVYYAALCVTTNDLSAELVVLPVKLTVTDGFEDRIFSDRFAAGGDG